MHLEQGLAIRTYTRKGHYPQDSYSKPEARLEISSELVFSAVLQRGSASYSFYTEMDWICPEETRLLSALALSVPYGYGTVSFYTDAAPTNIAFRDTPSRRAVLASNVGKYAKKLIDIWKVEPPNLQQPAVWEAVRSMAKHDFQRLGGLKSSYAFQAKNLDPDLQDDLYTSIDINDDLLIRGLSCLLKGEMLAKHLYFIEEAAINAYIALEAALRLILRLISSDSRQTPKIADALSYIEVTFPRGEDLADYFRLSYDNRIKTIHPESRFGASWAAPIMADDYLITYDELCAVYRHILTKNSS